MSHTIQKNKDLTYMVSKNDEVLRKNQYWKNIEFNRYGIIAMALLIQSCIGSFGVYYAVQFEGLLSISILSSVIMANMAANAMCLAVAPMKVIFWFGGVSVFISLIAIGMGLTML